MTGPRSERLSVLSDAKQYALYGLPDFDEGQRAKFLSLSPQELRLAFSRPSLYARVHCALQIGYSRRSTPSFTSLGMMCGRIATSS